jgi:hypothetical protein
VRPGKEIIKTRGPLVARLKTKRTYRWLIKKNKKIKNLLNDSINAHRDNNLRNIDRNGLRDLQMTRMCRQTRENNTIILIILIIDFV